MPIILYGKAGVREEVFMSESRHKEQYKKSRASGRRLVALGFVSALAMSAFMGQAFANAQKIVVYTVIPEEDVNRKINEEFTRQTGIQVELLNVPAVGTLASRIESEAAHPRADVFAAAPIDFHENLAKKGLLEPYKSDAVTQEALAKGYADPNGYWTGWYGMTTTIFWNKDGFASDVAPKGVAEPKAWDDLLNPAYSGQIVLSNPQTSAIGYVLLATQIFRLGEDKAWEYVKSLNGNVAQYTPSAPLTVTLVEKGEAAVGAFWLADVLTSKIKRQQPVEFVVPQDNVVNVWAASVIKGGPNTEGAKKYVDFLLTEFPQQVNAENGFRHPLNPKVSPPPGAPALADITQVKYDTKWATENMDRVRKQWADVTGQ